MYTIMIVMVVYKIFYKQFGTYLNQTIESFFTVPCVVGYLANREILTCESHAQLWVIRPLKAGFTLGRLKQYCEKFGQKLF